MSWQGKRMTYDSKFVDLVTDIYDAALEPSLWKSTLFRIGDYFNAQGGLLIGFSWASEAVSLFEAAPGDPVFQEMYRTKYARNPWGDRAILQPIGHGFTTDDLVDLSSLKRTEYYEEHLKPQEIIHGVVACLAGNRDFLAGITIHRSEKCGRFERTERERWQAIIPHIQRAVQLQLRAEGWNPLHTGAQHALDELALGVILLGPNGTVLHTNEAAARILEQKDGIALDKQDLRIVDSGAAAKLRLLVADASAPGREPQSGGSAMAVPRAARSPLQLLVSPVTKSARSPMRNATAVIFIRDPERTMLPKAQWLVDLYGVTPAEARVALAIGAGAGVQSTAHQLGIGPNTVKTHLATIFAKTGLRTQAQLAALIGGLFTSAH